MQNNNQLLNEILLVEDEQTPALIKKLLTHVLHLVQHKNLSGCIIPIVSKIIICIKTMTEEQNPEFLEKHKEDLNEMLYYTVDIISLVKNQQKTP